MSGYAVPIYLPRRRRIVTPAEWLRERLEDQRHEREALILAAKPTVTGTPAAAAATSLALPAHAIGDLILLGSYKDGATSIPTKPAAGGTVPAWADIDVAIGANLNAMSMNYFVATATNHTSGTWAGATGMAAIVLRGQAPVNPIGAHVQTGGAAASGAALTTTALTSPVLNGTSFFVYFFGWRTVTAWSAAPGGYTQQAQVATEMEILSKDDSTSEASFGPTGTASASGGYRSQSIEVRGAGAPPFAGRTSALRHRLNR